MPREHGVWGLLAGAALVGLPLGDHLAGLPLLFAAIGLVGVRQAWTAHAGWQSLAVMFAGGACTISAVLLVAIHAHGYAWMAWLGCAAVCASLGLVTQLGRPWWSSALSSAAFAALGGAVAAAGGAPSAWAVVGSVVLAAHFAASVPLVRAQIRPDDRWPRLALDLHALFAVCAVGCWAIGLVPSGVPLVFFFGLARVALIVDKRITMYAGHARPSPAAIGMREMAWLPVVAAGVVLGLRGGAW
jgi:hypothetical protein